MNDILAPQNDFSLDDLVSAPAQPVAPDSVLRNRAASYAALTDVPEEMIQDYQAMFAESKQGQDIVRSQIAAKAEGKFAQSKQAALMAILADPKISIEEKRAALERAKTSKIDPVDVLTTDSAIASVPNETADQENVRISLASSLSTLKKSREQMQGIVNAHALSLPPQDSLTTGVQAAEAWMLPFGTSKAVSQIVSGIRQKQNRPVTLVDFLQAITLPGSAKKELLTELHSMPPAERVAMLENFRSVINTSSDIILSENNFNKMVLGEELLTGDYGDTEAFFDNITPLFDALALGGLMKDAKALYKASKTVKPKPTVPPVNDALKTALEGQQVSIFDLAKTPEPPNVKGNGAAITKLEEEKAALLGDVSGKLGRGEVKKLEAELSGMTPPSKDTKALAKELQGKNTSYKQALAQAERAVSDAEAEYQATRLRIQNQLDANAKASQAEQRIAELEKQIEALKKTNTPNTAKTDLADAISRIGLRDAVSTHHPLAPGNVIGASNPNKARGLHALILNSEGDEAAKALFGETKARTLAGNVMPQPVTETGTVLAKTPDIESVARAGVNVQANILDIVKGGGALNFTQAERAAARAAIHNDFRNASGLVLNDAMSSFEVVGDKIKINGLYGTTNGGFSDAATALETAIISLRKYGIEPKDLTLYGRNGDEFIKLDSNAVDLTLGEYYVGVSKIDELPSSFAKDTDWSTKWNFLDRIAGLVNVDQGSLTRHLFTSGMIVDPKFTKAASRASDYTSVLEKAMLEIANKFADKFNALSKSDRDIVGSYIREANFNELPFDYVDLTGRRGFSTEMVETIQAWRRYWDNNFYLENLDMVRTLRNDGFNKFVGGNGTELIVKPILKNINAANVYDSSLDIMRVLSKKELDDLYNQGGTLARLRRPTQINGNTVEHVIVRQNANEYTRAVTDNDRILNYKDGYYQIQYQAPKFVDEIVDIGNGQKMRKAIAVAGDSLEAENFAKRMRLNNPHNSYIVRGDDRALARTSDDWWDLQEASGRIAQRHRGQLLQDSSGMNHLGDTDFILDPVNSAVRAARSIAGRTVGRPFLESVKARVMAKYGHVMSENPITHEKHWPRSINDIGEKGGQTSNDVKHARTMYEWVHAMENGYINSIDGTVKGLFHAVSSVFGESAKKGNKAAAAAERALGRSEVASRPTSTLKNVVFTTMVANNPLRQLVVQPHTAIRMYAYNPIAAAAGAKSAFEYIAAAAGAVQGNADFAKFVERSGMLDAVDKHNMVRGALLDASEASHPAAAAVGKVTGTVRKIGFDKGEQANQLLHLGAVYHNYLRQGKNLLDPAVAEEAYAEARALSYSMNFAGDMPYNQNALGFLLQFAQIPHKAFAQIFDRQLSVGARLRLVGADMMMFGVPAVAIGEAFNTDILPDDPKLRSMITEGIEQWSINNMFSQIAGRDVNIDISSLNPYDLSGWTKFFQAIFTDGGVEALVTNSPSGAVFFNEAGKVHNLTRSVLRMMNVVEDPMELTTLKDVGIEAARLIGGSGWTNAEKALYILEHGKRRAADGSEVGKDLGHMEAVAQLLGFGGYDEKQMFELSFKTSKAVKDKEDRWARDYKIVMKYYTDQLNAGRRDWDVISAITGHVFTVYKDDYEAQRYFMKRLGSDLRAGEDNANKVINQVMRLSGYVSPGEVKDQIRIAPGMTEEQKKQLIELVDYTSSLKGND